MYNPYIQSYQNQYMTAQAQRYEIVRVNGENGARAFQMSPNSSILLLDEIDPVVWLKVTDGAGYPTITPYEITPKQQKQADDIASLEARIAKLEGLFDESNITETAK